MRAVLERCGATEIRVAASEAERAGLWKSRKGAFTALATVLPDYYTIDGTIPRRCLPDVLDQVLALADLNAPGAAVNGYEAQQRDAALRPLTNACRQALVAACNSPLHA